MGRKLVRVPLPLFRTRPSTKSFYQVIKGSNVSGKVFNDSGNNIPGRSFNFLECYGRDTRSTGLCNISATAPKICDKFQEVCLRSNSGNRVLGMMGNSKTITFSLPQEKVQKIKSQCLEVYRAQEITLFVLTRLLGTLTSTIQAILRAQFQFRYLQQQQIPTLKRSVSYVVTVTLNAMVKEELAWWIKNLEFSNGQAFIQPPSQIVMRGDASKKGWGAVCQGIRTGGLWSKKKHECHINLLELLAIKFALLTFSKMINFKSVHIQVDNQTASSYLLKMGGTKSQELLRASKEIWDYLLKYQIMITAEYLPVCLNHQIDWESRNQKDSTKWKLCPQVFQKICQKVGQPEIDLFVSRLSDLPSAYYSWKPDPNSLALDALQQTWSHKHLYAFPPFSLIQSTEEGRVGESPFFDTDSTNLAEPDMVPRANSFVNEKSPTLTSTSKFLKEPSRRNTHFSSKSNNKVSCLDYYRQQLAEEEISERASNLIFHQEEKVLTQIIVCPGITW